MFGHDQSQKDEVTHMKFNQFSLGTLGNRFITSDNSIEIWPGQIAQVSRRIRLPNENVFAIERTVHLTQRRLSPSMSKWESPLLFAYLMTSLPTTVSKASRGDEFDCDFTIYDI
jgi:hypothetical protein